MKRAFPVLAAAALGFVCLESFAFHSFRYANWVSPDSSTGNVATILRNEKVNWQASSHNRVLAVGDSRMALVVKRANRLSAGMGISFGDAGMPGCPPRCWYYLLRGADPDANKYRAILFTLESYNDEDLDPDFGPEDNAERATDLNYLVPLLTWGDIAEFSSSYRSWSMRWRAAAGIAFKGFVYSRDIQDFLAHPAKRVEDVERARRFANDWRNDYLAPETSLAGLTVDWENRSLHLPSGITPEVEAALKRRLLEPLPPQTGERNKYMKYWLGRIVDRYRSSQTRLIFIRVPRAAWIRPDLPPPNPQAAARILEHKPNVTVIPEHFLDELEQPERFLDHFHLNRGGRDRFTDLLVPRVREILEPPR